MPEPPTREPTTPDMPKEPTQPTLPGSSRKKWWIEPQSAVPEELLKQLMPNNPAFIARHRAAEKELNEHAEKLNQRIDNAAKRGKMPGREVIEIETVMDLLNKSVPEPPFPKDTKV